MQFGYIASPNLCSQASGAWYYDNPDMPTEVFVCDSTCNAIRSQAGRIDLVLGCETVPAIIQ